MAGLPAASAFYSKLKAMLRTSLLFLLFQCITVITLAQNKSKTNQSSQADVDKMMEQALKGQGLSKEEMDEMKKGMEEAKKAMASMQSSGIDPANAAPPSIKIPARRQALLSQVPKLASKEQYLTYVKQLQADCKAKLPPAVVSRVEAALAAQKSDMAAQANLVPFYLLSKDIEAAIYTATKTASTYPGQRMVQNNLAVTLQQTGYAHKAIPILSFLLEQVQDPVLQNNLGQCYLSLGDTAKARQLFAACLKADPNNTHALSGTALIMDAAGKKAEAQQYVRKALKTGYSQLANELAKKYNLKPGFSNDIPGVPEYFNAQKYQPTPSADDTKQVRSVLYQRDVLRAIMVNWQDKYSKYEQVNSAKRDTEDLGQIAKRYGGHVSAIAGTGGVMAARARMMYDATYVEYNDFMLRSSKDFITTLSANKQLHEEMINKMDANARSGKFTSPEEGCKIKLELLGHYLKKSAENRNTYIRNYLHKLYDITNQMIYWSAFLMNKEEYKEYYLRTGADFIEQLSRMDELQLLYPTPENISYSCNGLSRPDTKKPEKDSAIEAPNCPLKLEVPLGAAKFKIDCETFSIEGGELLQGSIEKNFRTGEMTVFVGLGATLYEKGGVSEIGAGFEAGVKGGIFITTDEKGNVIDYGDKFEAGIEAGLGPFTSEAKVTGVLGMESGGRLETSVGGVNTMIWKTQ